MQKVKGIYDDDGQLLMMATLTYDKPMMGALFYLGVVSGLRISDLLALRFEDVGREFVVTEGKTGKKKRVVLPKEGWQFVQLYAESKNLATGDRLFPTTRQTVLRYFKRVANDLGLDGIGTHTMRKTYGWNVWRLTYDIDVVREAMNHKYVSTTVMYLVDGFAWLSGAVFRGFFGGIFPSFEDVNEEREKQRQKKCVKSRQE